MAKPEAQKYRTKNWSACNAALKTRGSLLVWFDLEMAWFVHVEIPSQKVEALVDMHDARITTHVSHSSAYDDKAEWRRTVQVPAFWRDHGHTRDPNDRSRKDAAHETEILRCRPTKSLGTASLEWLPFCRT
jgi:hypothetical protein